MRVREKKPGGRCDSFVAGTGVRCPTDMSLLWDAVRCLVRETGRAARAVRQPGPLCGRHREAEARCRCFRNSTGRMRCDGHRSQGMQAGSGVVESGCRRFGLRLKRPGTRWPERGANAMPALRSCVMNRRLPAFLDWKARQAVGA